MALKPSVLMPVIGQSKKITCFVSGQRQLGSQSTWDLPTCYHHLAGQYGSCLAEGQSVQGGLSGQQKQSCHQWHLQT